MELLLPLQATLSLVAFMANLIDLIQFNTIIVLHDQSNRNQINFVIGSLQPRYDVTWMLINDYANPSYWNHTIIKDEKILILTALHPKNCISLLMQLYNKRKLNIRSKNLIVSSEIPNFTIKTLPRTWRSEQINAVIVDLSHADVRIYAWNPEKRRKIS